jgi:hypothetical protein
MMSDWGNVTDGATSGRPNEITVLFADRALSFPMSAAATLADLAERLAAEGGPHRQMVSVTVKLSRPIDCDAGLAAIREDQGPPSSPHFRLV